MQANQQCKEDNPDALTHHELLLPGHLIAKVRCGARGKASSGGCRRRGGDWHTLAREGAACFAVGIGT